MFWMFIMFSMLGLGLFKLGAMSVMVSVLAAALQIAFLVIAILVALVLWNRFFASKKQ